MTIDGESQELKKSLNELFEEICKFLHIPQMVGFLAEKLNRGDKSEIN